MLYLAIPAHNEAATIGVLLWRLRTVLAEFPREYEAVVYDDASNDSTSEILESYARVMPLTVLRGERKVGYAGAVDALVRHVARHTRYPRRDAMLLLQGDFTDSPQLVPEFVKRFEGGTDVVVGEREASVGRKAPTPVRRLLRAEPWLLRFFVKAEGIRDLTSSYRLIRISVLRDLLRTVGDAAVCVGDARTANADFLMRIVPLARRIEGLPVEPTWDVRLRETRVDAMADGMNLLKWAWRSRGRKAVPSTAPDVASEAPRQGRIARDGRADLTSDVSITVAENGRANLRDAANRTRRNKPVRGEGRTDSRNEVRTDTRAEGRPERAPRNDNRPPKPDTRNDARTDSRRDAPVKLVTADNGDDTNELDAVAGVDAANAGDSVRERPSRRKRSRSRRDRGASAETQGADGTSTGSIALDPFEKPALAERTHSAPVIPDEADAADAHPAEVELSANLSEAVAAAEAELDIPGHTRPARKKRRRRGGRGGRAAGQTAIGDETGDDKSADNGSSDSDAGDDSDEGEREFRQAETRRGDFRKGGRRSGQDRASRDNTGDQEAGSDRGENSNDNHGDGAVSDFSADFTGSESGDEGDSGESSAGASERVRRRGRRGRRGGSRRSRAARGESAGESGGTGDGDAARGDSGGDNSSADYRGSSDTTGDE